MKKRENFRVNPETIRNLVIWAGALLLPVMLAIPAIPFSWATIVSMLVGVGFFYLIVLLTADKKWKKPISWLPLLPAVLVGITYIPLELTGLMLLGYYILVVPAILFSAGSHLIEWIRKGKERKSPKRRNKKEEEEGEDDE